LIEVDRLHNVGTATQPVHVEDLLFLAGGRQDDDWQVAQVLVAGNLGQHFPPVHSGQVQIEENQIRSHGSRVGPLFAQKRHALFAIVHIVQVDRQLGDFEPFARQDDVVFVVLNQQDFRRSGLAPDGVHGWPLVFS
jgi:hypothetical protein